METIAIIALDGKPVGIADTAPQGVGLIAWFHRNAGGQSADYYLQHGGYSVDEREPDCSEVTPLLEAIAARVRLTMDSTFVPFSQSRHAAPGADGKPWRSLNWRVTLKRDGREVLTTDYAQGEAHAPAAQVKPPALQATDKHIRERCIAFECETGRVARYMFGSDGMAPGIKPIPAPSIGDVLYSLARDADVLDAGGFESWAADLGYDPDSRKAEATYNQCVEIATKLRAALGEPTLAELQLAARFN